MHRLTPAFILEQAAQGRHAGTFDAVVLFVDTSGFTPLTARLAAYEREGAEAVAGILTTVFQPPFAAIYAQGGFIAGFAGDAFKAIFPGMGADSYVGALAASEMILAEMRAQPRRTTRFGRFDFSVRVSMAAGRVEWRIWSGRESGPDQRRAYCFYGPALDAAIVGEDHAAGGG